MLTIMEEKKCQWRRTNLNIAKNGKKMQNSKMKVRDNKKKKKNSLSGRFWLCCGVSNSKDPEKGK